MPLVNFRPAPGINKEVTDYTGEGKWTDGDNVRFFQGLPQKIKGWEKFISTTLVGVARDQHAWIALDGTRYDAIGTDRKLYVLEEGVAFDITPIRETFTSQTSVFTTTTGSSNVTVSISGHGASVGAFVTFDNVTLSNTSTSFDATTFEDKEFEVKGNGAKLGPKGGIPSDAFARSFADMGVTFEGGKFSYNGKSYNKSGLSYLLSDLYSKENKPEVERTLKNFLNNVVGVPADTRFSKIEWNNPGSINRNIGLMHFIDYASKEGFSHFLVHDFGSGTKLKGGNTGKYIYVNGSPESMAEGLDKLGVTFEKITYVLFRPRIGFATSYLGEDETE